MTIILQFQSSFELTGYITVKNNMSKYLVHEFQSSFELTGYITVLDLMILASSSFQSSFELTGYITNNNIFTYTYYSVSKLFRAYRLYNWQTPSSVSDYYGDVSKLFRAYRLYNIQEIKHW